MGKLQTAVTLPKRILLQGWALSSFGEDINGVYTFQNTPSLGSQVTYLPDNQGDGVYLICFFGTSWVIREIGDATQEWRVISTNKVLPLNNWVQVSSAGPAGTITILENISGKNNKISIKKQNLGGGRIIVPKPVNLFTCPFEVDTDTCPSAGLSNSAWRQAQNTSRIGKTTAPDGSNTAVEYESFLTSDSYISQGFLQYWRPYTKYKFSIWAKKTYGNPIEGQIINVTKNGGTDRVYLDAVGNLTSTWQKFTITFTTGPSMSSYITAFFGGDLTIGTRIAFWGAEMYRYD